ncbi:tumor necrosis factor receptor superfamily member 16-like [Mya arenaria]|uniref:tumor necrosis factor receptor superfamily member 16-like n=1 Tax=Mya arenaria TaxID=6604 RepID=UPI0022E8AEC3|nr:tumor necrosis factor receptor superfamily member 16-like [Mya arenaria]
MRLHSNYEKLYSSGPLYFLVWIYLMNIQSVLGVLPYSIRQKTSGYRSKGCPSGKYYDEENNGKRNCRKCVICPKGYTEHLPCSKTTNRSCKPCEIGTTFTDKRGGICRNCTECQRGQFVSRQCLPFKDTRCKICPNGTYSLDWKGFGCKYCSVCKEHEEEVSPCTPLHNRECSLKEDYTFGTTNPWNTGPEYNKDFNFSTRLVLLSLLMVVSCSFFIFLFATILQTISSKFQRITL